MNTLPARHMIQRLCAEGGSLLHRTSGASWRSLGEYTVLLGLFSAAAIKGLDMRLLALSLLGEGHSVLRLLRRVTSPADLAAAWHIGVVNVW